MIHKFLEKILVGVFFVILMGGCSTVPNLTQAQDNATSTPLRSEVGQTVETAEKPEQIVKKYIEIGFNKDLSFEEKEKQVEDCCLIRSEQDTPPKSEANLEYVKQRNPAGHTVTMIELLYDELAEVKVRCLNSHEAVVDSIFRVKGKKQLITSYFKLIKQNSKWIVKEVSDLEIPKCQL